MIANMTQLFVLTTATLTLVIGVLLGIVLTERRDGRIEEPSPPRTGAAVQAEPVAEAPQPQISTPTSINFADIAARLNPAVVNIDATARARRARRLVEEGGRRGGPADRSRR